MAEPIKLPPECTEAEWQAAKDRTDAWRLGLSLPNGWTELDLSPALMRLYPALEGQRAFEHRDGRHVVGTVGQHDGRWWLHVSVSRAKYVPSYDDLAEVKRVFIGDDLQAVQVFPRRVRHVNLHAFCLHLWACVEPDGDGLPDFGRDGTI